MGSITTSTIHYRPADEPVSTLAIAAAVFAGEGARRLCLAAARANHPEAFYLLANNLLALIPPIEAAAVSDGL